MQTNRITALSSTASLAEAIHTHWKEYLMEAAELGMLMLCVCSAGTLLYGHGCPLDRFMISDFAKSIMMGVAISGSAYMIIRSPFGRRSGAHFNPALTLAYFWLGRVHRWDALSYVVTQFVGAVAGVSIARLILGARLADLPVRYVVTLPGSYGYLLAFVAEFALAFVSMGVVLVVSNHRQLAKYSPLFVAAVTVSYYAFCSSIAGFSANPARSFSSALFARLWQGIWIYFLAPILGMLAAAACYKRFRGANRIYCAKVFHDLDSVCPFNCHFQKLQDCSGESAITQTPG